MEWKCGRVETWKRVCLREREGEGSRLTGRSFGKMPVEAQGTAAVVIKAFSSFS